MRMFDNSSQVLYVYFVKLKTLVEFLIKTRLVLKMDKDSQRRRRTGNVSSNNFRCHYGRIFCI